MDDGGVVGVGWMIELLSTRSLSDEARTDANGDHVIISEARQIAVTVMATWK